MATFITTIKFTQQGIKDIDETTKRAAAVKASARSWASKSRTSTGLWAITTAC